jgi:hypothetical protein
MRTRKTTSVSRRMNFFLYKTLYSRCHQFHAKCMSLTLCYKTMLYSSPFKQAFKHSKYYFPNGFYRTSALHSIAVKINFRNKWASKGHDDTCIQSCDAEVLRTATEAGAGSMRWKFISEIEGRRPGRGSGSNSTSFQTNFGCFSEFLPVLKRSFSGGCSISRGEVCLLARGMEGASLALQRSLGLRSSRKRFFVTYGGLFQV